MRRAVPSPAPKRIFGIHVIRSLLDQGVVVICAGGGGIPTAYGEDAAPAGRQLRGVEAVIDKDLASALLAIEIGADALLIVTDVDAVYADWGTPQQRAIRNATPDELAGGRVRRGLDGSEGPRRVLVRRAHRQASLPSESIDDTQALLSGDAGTRVATGAAERRRPHWLRGTDMATTEAAPTPTTDAPVWHSLSREDAARELGVEPGAGLTSEEAAERLARYGPNKFAEAKAESRCARVPAPVPGPDADRAAGRRRDLDLSGQAAGHGDRDPAADAAERDARPQPGGQGRGGGGGAGQDDDRQGASAARRRARAAAGRAARAGRHRRRSRPATWFPPTGACWPRRRSRSPRRR